MAAVDVENILKGLQLGQQKANEARQRDLEQQRITLEDKTRSAEMVDRQQRLIQEKKISDAQMQLAQKAADLSHLTSLTQLGAAAKSGVPIPGATYSDANQGGGGAVAFSGANNSAGQQIQAPQPSNNAIPIGQQYQNIQLPVNDSSGQPITIPNVASLDVQAGQQAARERVLNAPAEESKTREQLAQIAGEQTKSLAMKDLDYKRVEDAKAADFAREVQRNSTQIYIEKMRNDSAERVAKAKNQGESFDVEPLIDDAMHGHLSQEELNKMAISKSDKSRIMSGVLQQGGRIFTQTQKDLTPDLINAVKVVPLMDDFLSNQSQTTNWFSAQLGGLGSTFDSHLNNLQDQIKSQTMAIAKTVQGAKGQRIMNLELQLAQGGFVPKRNQTVSENIDRRNNYVKGLQDIVKAKLDGVPAKQANLTMQDIGVLDIPILDPKTGKPIKNVQQQIQQNPQPQLSPAAIELMKKHGIQ
jgi:hypothetical protein